MCANYSRFSRSLSRSPTRLVPKRQRTSPRLQPSGQPTRSTASCSPAENSSEAQSSDDERAISIRLRSGEEQKIPRSQIRSMNRWEPAPVSIAPSANFSRPEFSISFGVGLAYEVAGINFAARFGHVEAYVGLGVASLWPGGASFGSRLFLRDDGSGFFLGVNLAAHAPTIVYGYGFFDDPVIYPSSGFLGWATLTPGYRFVWGKLFFQVALGAGIYYQQTSCPTCTPDIGPTQQHSLGFLPDGAISGGLRF